MRGTPKVLVAWKDTINTLMAVEGLVITETSLSGFKVATRRIDTSYNWWFCYLAIYK